MEILQRHYLENQYLLTPWKEKPALHALNQWLNLSEQQWVNLAERYRHDDLTFSKAGLTLTNGANSFTAIIGPDSFSRKYTNTVSVNAPNSITYSYDSNGNLTSDGTRSFSYDDENQLTHVEVSNGWRVWYQYDEQGRRRVRKEYTLSGGSSNLVSETRYLYDGRLVIQERDGSNARLVSYTRGLDLSGSLDGAGGIGGLIARTEHTSYGLPHSYYHHDGNGNVIAMANSQGQVVARYLYEPFGTIIGMSGWLAETNTMRFSGKEYDQTAGIYYYGFRFYEPNLQRWLNQDPIGEEGGINLYRYAGNNSINATDSEGREIFYANHEVKAGYFHSKIVIIPNDQFACINDPRFLLGADGLYFATIGAGPDEPGWPLISARLIANLNRPTDVGQPHNNRNVLTVPSRYSNEREAIDALFQAVANYKQRGTVGYTLYPVNEREHNSNSFISGLLSFSGFVAPANRGATTPGWQYPVQSMQFVAPPPTIYKLR